MRREVKAMRSGLAQDAAARESEVNGMLKDFQGSRQQMGAEQMKLLADYDRGIKSEVAGMRQETIADLRKARTAWQAVASNGHAKGGGAEILPKGKALVGKEEPHLGRASKSLLDKKLIRKKHKVYVPASAK